jgi:hypothetical protein
MIMKQLLETPTNRNIIITALFLITLISMFNGNYILSILFAVPIILIYINFQKGGMGGVKQTTQRTNSNEPDSEHNYSSYRAQLFSSMRDKKDK